MRAIAHRESLKHMLTPPMLWQASFLRSRTGIKLTFSAYAGLAEYGMPSSHRRFGFSLDAPPIVKLPGLGFISVEASSPAPQFLLSRGMPIGTDSSGRATYTAKKASTRNGAGDSRVDSSKREAVLEDGVELGAPLCL